MATKGKQLCKQIEVRIYLQRPLLISKLLLAKDLLIAYYYLHLFIFYQQYVKASKFFTKNVFFPVFPA